MHIFLRFVIFSVIALAVSCHASEAESIAAGKNKSASCAACHGANGIATIDIYPNLAGQNKGYLISSMKAYRDKQRSGGMAAVMVPMVAALSDDDINNLAAYYNSLPAQ